MSGNNMRVTFSSEYRYLHKKVKFYAYLTKFWYSPRFFQAYRAAGIDFWGMTVQNEPMTGWDPWFPWNTCGFNAEMERDFAKLDLGPIMEEGGFAPGNFSIMVLDHNRPLALDWAITVFSDAEASRYVAGLAVHWYFYGTAGPYQVYDNIHTRFPDKFILGTEACNRNEIDGDHIGLGLWYLAEDYAHDILLNLLHWVGGWTDWNLVLDDEGGPNWVGNTHSAPIIVNPGAGEFYKNTQFYAMAHFSKFLPPGSIRIGASPGVEVNLHNFINPDDKIYHSFHHLRRKVPSNWVHLNVPTAARSSSSSILPTWSNTLTLTMQTWVWSKSKLILTLFPRGFIIAKMNSENYTRA